MGDIWEYLNAEKVEIQRKFAVGKSEMKCRHRIWQNSYIYIYIDECILGEIDEIIRNQSFFHILN